MSILAVIPARGGSKRIPMKNVRPMLGKPLIAYTVEAALESGLFDRVVVSTDSASIAEAAARCGAEVPFVREQGLADDHTPVSLATLDALERIDPGSSCAAVAQLMANCPLRTAADIRDSHAEFRRSGAESQISVTRFGWLNPWWAMRRDGSGRLEPLFEERGSQRSQDQPALFCPTGAIWWARPPALRREKTFHMAGRTGWEIDWRHAVDIDTLEDWDLAETLLSANTKAAHV
jgi:N-acylneuraminate cytidylyltransferase